MTLDAIRARAQQFDRSNRRTGALTGATGTIRIHGTFTLAEGGDTVWLDDISFPPFNLEIPDIAISPVSRNFGTVFTGASSAPQVFTLSNAGTGNLVLGTITISGTNASEFTKQDDTCSGQTLPASGSCSTRSPSPRRAPKTTSPSSGDSRSGAVTRRRHRGGCCCRRPGHAGAAQEPSRFVERMERDQARIPGRNPGDCWRDRACFSQPGVATGAGAGALPGPCGKGAACAVCRRRASRAASLRRRVRTAGRRSNGVWNAGDRFGPRRAAGSRWRCRIST